MTLHRHASHTAFVIVIAMTGISRVEEAEVNASCDVSTFCPDRMTCDRGLCKLFIGDRCNSAAECLAGALCTSGKCTCPDFTVPYGTNSKCGNLFGRPCKDVDDCIRTTVGDLHGNEIPTGAHCTHNKCLCSNGTVPAFSATACLSNNKEAGSKDGRIAIIGGACNTNFECPIGVLCEDGACRCPKESKHDIARTTCRTGTLNGYIQGLVTVITLAAIILFAG